MKKITSKVIVVEGKYDKIRLENLIDGVIITTEGFGIFNSPEKCSFIKRIADERGIIVLTDPDGAGKVIRSHISTLTGKNGVINAYIPQIEGKERRKAEKSKAGFLGVEGVPDEILLGVLEKAGAFDNAVKSPCTALTKADLYRLGFYGVPNAAAKRAEFLKENSLPGDLSPTAFLDAVNLLGIEIG